MRNLLIKITTSLIIAASTFAAATQQAHTYQSTDTGKVMEHTLHRILEHHQIAQFTIT